MNDFIEAVAKLTPMVISILIFIVVLVFRKEISKRLRDSKLKVKKGDTEIQIENESEILTSSIIQPDELSDLTQSDTEIDSNCDELEGDEDKNEVLYDQIISKMSDALATKNQSKLEDAVALIDEQQLESDEIERLEAARLCVKSALGCRDSLVKLKKLEISEQNYKVSIYNYKMIILAYSIISAYDDAASIAEIALEFSINAEDRHHFILSRINNLSKDNRKLEAIDVLNLYVKKNNTELDEEKLVDLYRELSILYKETEQITEFMVTICHAIKKAPNDTDLLFRLGYNSESLFSDIAMFAYDKSLGINKDDCAVKNNIAIRYGQFEIKEKRIDMFNEIKEMGGLYAANIASDYIQKGFYKEAEEVLNISLELKFKHDNIYKRFKEISDLRDKEAKKEKKVLESARTKLKLVQRISQSYLIGDITLDQMLGGWKDNANIDYFISKVDNKYIVNWHKDNYVHEVKINSSKNFGMFDYYKGTKDINGTYVSTFISKGVYGVLADEMNFLYIDSESLISDVAVLKRNNENILPELNIIETKDENSV